MDTKATARTQLGNRLGKWLREAREVERHSALHSDENARNYWLFDSLTRLAGDEVVARLATDLRMRRPLVQVEARSCDFLAFHPGEKRPSAERPDGLMGWWRFIVEALIPEWIDALAEEGSPAAPKPEDKATPLGKNARAVLGILGDARAFNESAACPLSKRAATATRFERALKPSTRKKYAEEGARELRSRGLIDALMNRGTWLTPTGKLEWERINGMKPGR